MPITDALHGKPPFLNTRFGQYLFEKCFVFSTRAKQMMNGFAALNR
jgi:hypothetical protein